MSFIQHHKSSAGQLVQLCEMSIVKYLVCLFCSQNGVEHAHAFIYSPEACRFCDVEHNLNGEHDQTHISNNSSASVETMTDIEVSVKTKFEQGTFLWMDLYICAEICW